MTYDERVAEFKARIDAGQKIEAGEWLPDEYRLAAMKFIEMHANSEVMGALPEREWIPRAPTLRRKLSLTAKVQDEVGHGQILYRVAEDLGKSREQMFDDLVNGRTKFHNVFHYPAESWGDVAVIGWLIDGAALVTQKALLDASYAPYVRAMRRICAEESLHLRHGEELTLELVDAQTENVIWGEQYNRKQADIVALQSEIARDVSSRLRTKLSGADEAKVTKTYTANPGAYQLYLKGRFYFDKRTKEDVLRSIESYQQAISLDPNFALAHVGIADSYGIMSAYGYAAPNDVFPQAKAAARRALQIDPDLAEAHAAYAKLVAEYDWNWSEAEREYKRSIELNPNVALTHYQYGVACLTPLGRFDEATNELKRALELEPLSVPAMANLAGVHVFARKNDLAVAQGREALRLEPNHPTARFFLGFAYDASGMYAEAISICEPALRGSG